MPFSSIFVFLFLPLNNVGHSACIISNFFPFCFPARRELPKHVYADLLECATNAVVQSGSAPAPKFEALIPLGDEGFVLTMAKYVKIRNADTICDSIDVVTNKKERK